MFENQNAAYEKQAIDSGQSAKTSAMAQTIVSPHGRLNEAAPAPSQSADLIERIAHRLSAVESLKNRVGMVADRLAGPVPSEPQKGNGVQAQPQNLTGKLQLIDDFLVGLEQQLRNNVERLEQFV